MFAVNLLSAWLDAVPISVAGTLCHPQRLIVRTQDLGQPEIKECKILRNFKEIGLTSIEVPIGSLPTTYARWKAWGLPVYLDRAALPAFAPNDALYPDSWHHPFMKSDLAWDLGLGTANPVVAVIDTGLKTDHPDLAANVWVNADEVPGNNVDDDLNGYVDDINGYDFAYNDPIPNDVFGHGTACAGLVGAVQNNTIGVSGVAPRARLMGLKSALDSGYFYDSENIAAYLYAAENGANILSCSFFSDRVSDPERLALEYCVSQGIVPFVAAGNSNFIYPYYPAAYECCVAVAAINGNGNKASFSDYGSWVDIATPGTSLRTTTTDDGYTAGFAGTSGACPLAAGVGAMIMSRVPTISGYQLRTAMEDTGISVTYGTFGEYCNYGKVNAQAALQAAIAGTWPGRTSTVRYMTPYSVSNPQRSRTRPTSRIYGRGFQSPRLVELKQDGRRLNVVSQSRDYVDFQPVGSLSPIEVRVNGSLIRTLPAAQEMRNKWPLIEASNGDRQVSGGFEQALFADGTSVTTGVRNDESIDLYMTFRLVDRTRPLKLRIKRSYTGFTGGTEDVEIYDWASNSYPYGSYVRYYTGPLSGTPTGVQTLDLVNPSRFVDDEGTMYVHIRANTPGVNTQLSLDLAEIVD